MKFPKSFQEFIYSLSTNDKYSEFDSRKSFNRVNKPISETEANLLSHHNGSQTFHGDLDEDPNYEKFKQDGVHEVRLAWRHIKNWLNKNSADLNSSLQKACTDDDLNDFQKDLNTKLPYCVQVFYKLTDGQLSDDYNKVGGLFFGLKLMSLDEVLVMTEHWRKVSKKLTTELSQLSQSRLKELPKMTSYRGSTSSIDLVNKSVDLVNSTADLVDPNSSSLSLLLDDENLASKYPSQKSIPPGAIHPIFAHPQWIPLITDEVGNCIGIDLCPPNNGDGKWGQVILFGREFDTKFLIADNFGDFLLIFANDLEKGNWDIKAPEKNNYGDLMIGNEGDLVFVDQDTKQEVNYLTVLKQRCISRWIESLDEEKLDKKAMKLIKDLKLNPDSILNVKQVNDNSIDHFINTNLNLVSDMIKNVESSQTKPIASDSAKEQKPEPVEEVIKSSPKPKKEIDSFSGEFAYSEGKTLDDVDL